MDRLLQSGFEIRHRQRTAAAFHALQFRRNDAAQNEITRDLQAAVQINRRQNRFERVHQQGGLTTASTFFLAAPQPQIVTKFQLLRHANQMPLADQVRPQLRKLTFAKMWEALKEFFAGHQRQHRIAQKLELLVVADGVLAVARLLRFLFSRLRTVGDRLLNYRPTPEMVPEPFFQRRNFPFLHAEAWPNFRPFRIYFLGESVRAPHPRSVW